MHLYMVLLLLTLQVLHAADQDLIPFAAEPKKSASSQLNNPLNLDPRMVEAYQIETKNLFKAYQDRKKEGNEPEAQECYRLISKRMQVPTFLLNFQKMRTEEWQEHNQNRLKWTDLLIKNGEPLEARSVLLELKADKKVPEKIRSEVRTLLKTINFQQYVSTQPSSSSRTHTILGASNQNKQAELSTGQKSFVLKLKLALKKLNNKENDSAEILLHELIEAENAPKQIKGQASLTLGAFYRKNKDTSVDEDTINNFLQVAADQGDPITRHLARFILTTRDLEKAQKDNDKNKIVQFAEQIIAESNRERERIEKLGKEKACVELTDHPFSSTCGCSYKKDPHEHYLNENEEFTVAPLAAAVKIYTFDDNPDLLNYEKARTHCDLLIVQDNDEQAQLMGKIALSYMLREGLGGKKDAKRAQELITNVLKKDEPLQTMIAYKSHAMNCKKKYCHTCCVLQRNHKYATEYERGDSSFQEAIMYLSHAVDCKNLQCNMCWELAKQTKDPWAKKQTQRSFIHRAPYANMRDIPSDIKKQLTTIAENVSKQTPQDSRLHMEAQLVRGAYLVNNKEYKGQALTFLEPIADQSTYIELQVGAQLLLAEVYTVLEDRPQAVALFEGILQQNITFDTIIGKSPHEIKEFILSNLTETYAQDTDLKDLDKSLCYCNQYIEYLQKNQNDNDKKKDADLIRAYYQLADIYQQLSPTDLQKQLRRIYQKVVYKEIAYFENTLTMNDILARDERFCKAAIALAHMYRNGDAGEKDINRAKDLFYRLTHVPWALKPSNIAAEASYIYAKEFAQNTDFQKGLFICATWGTNSAHSVNAYFQLGLIAKKTNSWDDAIRYFEVALAKAKSAPNSTIMDEIIKQAPIEREHARYQSGLYSKKIGCYLVAFKSLKKAAEQNDNQEVKALANKALLDMAISRHSQRIYLYHSFKDISTRQGCDPATQARAQYYQARMLYYGQGVTADVQESRKLMEQVAKQDHDTVAREKAKSWLNAPSCIIS